MKSVSIRTAPAAGGGKPERRFAKPHPESPMRKAAKALYVASTRKLPRGVTRIEWDKADWSKSNQEIADELGCHHESVRKKRAEIEARRG